VNEDAKLVFEVTCHWKIWTCDYEQLARRAGDGSPLKRRTLDMRRLCFSECRSHVGRYMQLFSQDKSLVQDKARLRGSQ
jgi:hypothetical protein